mmetsp:Transcript_5133/g.10032  ORF Transcript_5133/g.10032 Transcript_5133/m.10032 type:complete len:278 (+) Transcript_5133:1026-1859(+)
MMTEYGLELILHHTRLALSHHLLVCCAGDAVGISDNFDFLGRFDDTGLLERCAKQSRVLPVRTHSLKESSLPAHPTVRVHPPVDVEDLGIDRLDVLSNVFCVDDLIHTVLGTQLLIRGDGPKPHSIRVVKKRDKQCALSRFQVDCTIAVLHCHSEEKVKVALLPEKYFMIRVRTVVVCSPLHQYESLFYPHVAHKTLPVIRVHLPADLERLATLPVHIRCTCHTLGGHGDASHAPTYTHHPLCCRDRVVLSGQAKCSCRGSRRCSAAPCPEGVGRCG